MSKFIPMLVAAAVTVAGPALLAGTAVAQDGKAINLRVADSFPAGHFIPATATIPWMEDVTKKTNGRVKFEYFPAQQLGKARSEEHTSELQSLMRSSYAVFCLKKKK